MADFSASSAAATAPNRAYPTSEEMADWRRVADVMQWLGMNTEDVQDTIETNMLEHMGLAVDTPLRDLALIQADDYDAELLEFTFNGKKAPLSFRTKAKLLANLARVAFGLDYTPEQKLAWEEKRQAEEAEQQARVAQQTVQLAAAIPPAPSSGRKVNMRIALQERSDEVEPISFDMMEAARDRYLEKMHTKRIPR